MTFAIQDLRGSIPPLVVPFRDGNVDFSAQARLIETVLAGGSHGIVVNGTTGEPTSLTLAERKALLESAVKAVAGRVPVVAATGGQNFAETVELTRAAAAAGASALLVVTPYFIKPPVRGLIEYYEAIARLTPLPLLIYHIPGRAGVTMPAAAMVETASRAPTLVGVKHASTDLGFVTELLALRPDFRIFAGLEDLSFPMMALGAVGLMNAAGNIVPRRIVDLAESAAAGEMARARELHYQLYKLNQAIFWDTNPIPLKYMMKRLGILAHNEHRLPMAPATPELMRRLDELLEDLQLLPQRSAS
jgi:4-hydroxy-tetrahydrodipicolinate synthase